MCLTCALRLRENYGEPINCPVCRIARVRLDIFNHFAESIRDALFGANTFTDDELQIENPEFIGKSFSLLSFQHNFIFTFFTLATSSNDTIIDGDISHPKTPIGELFNQFT